MPKSKPMHVSWRGNRALKDELLSQLTRQRDVAQMEDIELDGCVLGASVWSKRFDLRELSCALGVPPLLLSVGLFLYEGFPDGPRQVREQLSQYLEFYAAIPVGRDLTHVVPGLLVWWLTDPAQGLYGVSEGPELRDILDGVALGLLEGECREAPVLEAIARREAQLRALRGRGEMPPSELLLSLRILESSLAACRSLESPTQGRQAIERALLGGSGGSLGIVGAEEALRSKMVELLVGFPG